jgi:hypothetical protein
VAGLEAVVLGTAAAMETAETAHLDKVMTEAMGYFRVAFLEPAVAGEEPDLRVRTLLVTSKAVTAATGFRPLSMGPLLFMPVVVVAHLTKEEHSVKAASEAAATRDCLRETMAMEILYFRVILALQTLGEAAVQAQVEANSVAQAALA